MRTHPVNGVQSAPPSGPQQQQQSIALSLCDGMGCLALALKGINARVDRIIGVECDEVARVICQNANPPAPESSFPGVDHSWHTNVFEIKEQDVIDLGYNSVKLLAWGAPCEDMSKLRLIRSQSQVRSGKDPRPGLDGPRGKVFRQCLLVTAWVVKHNPNVESFVENVDFSDMLANWTEVCAALGEPLMVCAEDHSYTKRLRAYWFNGVDLHLPDDYTCGYPPKPNSDECMDAGRTVQRYTANGTTHVRPIGKSWRGDPQNPVADTSRPVLVTDESCTSAQHLRPEEAERLMGMEPGCTAGQGVTPRQRLKCIGNGWDHNVTVMLLRYSSLSRLAPSSQTADIWSAIPELTALTTEEKTAQALLQIQQTSMEPSAFALHLSRLEPDHQIWCLSLLKHAAAQGGARTVSSNWSVLDSGSSRHLHGDTHVLDPDDCKSLTGFNGSTEWTTGSGYLPLHMTDMNTDQSVKVDIDDVDTMQGLQSNILSMGKLIRKGYDFHFTNSGKQCYGTAPGGAHRVRIDLGPDDILRVEHTIREGRDSAPIRALPQTELTQPAVQTLQEVCALRRTAAKGAYEFLHAVFNHCGDEKLFQTLGHTKGYVQTRMPPQHCNTCATTKARDFGLKQGTLNAGLCEEAPSSQGRAWLDHLSAQDRHVIAHTLARELTLVVVEPDPVFADPSDSGDDADAVPLIEYEFKAASAGRQLGIQPVPRFQLYTLKPFEVVFVDNKDFPCPVRGGKPTSLIFICYKTRAKVKVDLASKRENGDAFQRMVALFGIHKLPYHCRVLSDGCGSMAHVAATASRLGIDHSYIPPHQQSLNEAEKVADLMWAAARAHMVHSGAPHNLFSMAVDFSMYVDLRTSTTDSRGWLTPYEMFRGTQPSVDRLHVFYTKCFVAVPKAKRKALADKGLHNYRAEPGRFVGYHSLLSSTYAVMLDKEAHSVDRLVHSINVTFDDTDHSPCGHPVPAPCAVEVNLPAAAPLPAVGGMPEAKPQEANHGGDNSANYNPLFSQPYVNIGPLPQPIPTGPEYFSPSNTDWNLNGNGTPQPRPRPSYQNLVDHIMRDSDTHTVLHMVDIDTVDPGVLVDLCLNLAVQAQKDISWKEALSGPMRDSAIEALHLELASLTNTILTEIGPDHPERAEAERTAITGRFLLDIKRQGKTKVRGVKHGFKENTETADGPNFNYSAHVAKLKTVRTVIFRPNRGDRRLALKDVRVAFLQANKYPFGIVKYIAFRNPLTGQWHYYRQSGPIYGEKSAPVRWEETISPFFQSEGFVRGDNDLCAYLHEQMDLVSLLWVDDDLMDGDEESIQWASDRMDDRFDCKDLEWLEPNGDKLDYLGMEISQDDLYTYMSMCQYIANCVNSVSEMVGIPVSQFTPVSTPMDRQIDCDSTPLDAAGTRNLMTMAGFIGWLQLTMRVDMSHYYSRITQHLQKPTESAMASLIRAFRYLKGTINLCIAAPRHTADLNITDSLNAQFTAEADWWKFYTDSDHAGNTEVQNKRRNQYGYIALANGAPIDWASKVSSVAFAHPDIGESHPDMSSAAGEIYGAGNAACDMLQLSYIAEEVGVKFPKPAYLDMDNTAAEAFTDNSVIRTKLKHIDVRQHWVRCLRDKSIILPRHVPSADNLADFLTKILPPNVFIRLRDQIMRELPIQLHYKY